MAPRAPARTISSCPATSCPIVGRAGGVLVRAGLTEAAIDLARLAGRQPAAAVCAILKDDGSLADLDDLERWPSCSTSRSCAFPIWSPTACAPSRWSHRVAERTDHRAQRRPFRAVVYRNDVDGHEHMALVKGDGRSARGRCSVRLHSQCLTGDVFGSERCDCGDQLDRALQMIAAAQARRARLPASGRARHRIGEQAARLRAAGPGTRYGRGQPRARLSRRTGATTASGRRSCATWASRASV